MNQSRLVKTFPALMMFFQNKMKKKAMPAAQPAAQPQPEKAAEDAKDNEGEKKEGEAAE